MSDPPDFWKSVLVTSIPSLRTHGELYLSHQTLLAGSTTVAAIQRRSNPREVETLGETQSKHSGLQLYLRKERTIHCGVSALTGSGVAE
ncbi:hypothetical protein F2P79_010045 [Pimephales promelas]|nr:hypothetical protein F2P79_010045 [Pimephales promelas]